jgi:crotonobetainyl-CoA:carnitine CoA-transferase CaiB-like acyl-CoA transferase
MGEELVSDRAAPLAGVRVLDLCHFLAGPYATLVLADLGADVIKIEDPGRLDEARTLGPHFQDGQSLYFAALNWGKRSFSARLSTPEGRAAMLDLARTADVVVDNFRPGVTAKLGVDHAALTAVNPRIITCSLSGFGESGPYAARPGYDYTIQALAGVMSMTGEPEGPPGRAGISYVDHAGGLSAALAVTAALLQRSRTGAARHLDLALFDVQISMLTYLASWQLNAGFSTARTRAGAHPSIVPAQVFESADGYISIFVGNDAMWKRLIAVLEDPRLEDPAYAVAAGRHQHREAVLAVLGEDFRARGTVEWLERLTERAVPCAPVNDLADALADPQVQARGLIATAGHPAYGEYRHVSGPLACLAGGAQRRGAPLLGEHTAALLAELGYDEERIRRFVADIPAVAA